MTANVKLKYLFSNIMFFEKNPSTKSSILSFEKILNLFQKAIQLFHISFCPKRKKCSGPLIENNLLGPGNYSPLLIPLAAMLFKLEHSFSSYLMQ